MIILVLNCGSSSLKYQLLDMKGDEVYDLLAKGLVERIGMEVGCVKHQATGKEKYVKEMPIENHTVGIKAVLEALLDKEFGVLRTLEDIEKSVRGKLKVMLGLDARVKLESPNTLARFEGKAKRVKDLRPKI